MMAIFQKIAMMVCSLFYVHDTEGKKILSQKTRVKKKKFDKGSAIFHWGQKTLNWKV